MSDIFTVSSSVLPETTKVAGFRGSEGLSRPYVFDILLLMTNEEANDFDMADAISAKVTLTMHRADAGAPFVFHGIFSALELVSEIGKRAVFRGTLVPQLWQLTQTFHSRIFTQKSVPDVIKDVLEDSGLTSDDYSFRLLQSYKTEEHICQYRESNFDFISRWMEREGLYYFFEQGDDHEKLIITDDKSSHSPLAARAVRYFPQPGADVTAGESFRTFTCRHTSLPASVRLKDYDYAKPSLDVSGTAPVSPTGLGEISVYGARFFNPAEGKRLANLRSQELLARQVVFNAMGAAYYLRPGYTFDVEDHPRPNYNASYLALTVEHYGNQAYGAPEVEALLGADHRDVYRAEVVAIPATVQFRAESKTPWPRIYSLENATVDGPATSEYAQIDDQGRYAIKLKFDEGTLKDGKASTWVRMTQPHGGGIEGFHFPLRKNTEVVVSFLGGDPDRPIIAGVVPNTLTPSPVTSGNHTKNVIQTGGRNRLELEDLAGQQRVTLSTPYSNTYIRMGSPNEGHELIVKTDDNTLLDAGTTLTINSGTWREDHVKSDHFNTTVDGTVTDKFNGTHTTTVKDKVTETYNNGQETTVNAAIRTSTYNVGQTTTVNGGLCTENYNTGHLTSVLGGQTLNVKGGQHLNVEGDQNIDIQTTKTETVHGAYNLTINGATTVELKGPETHTVHGPFKKLYSSDNVNVVAGVKADVFLGAASSTTIGIQNSNFIGGKITLEASGALTATFSYKLEIAGGVALSYKFGAALSINSAVELTVKPTKIETGAAKISQLPTRLAMMGLRYHLSGVHVLS